MVYEGQMDNSELTHKIEQHLWALRVQFCIKATKLVKVQIDEYVRCLLKAKKAPYPRD